MPIREWSEDDRPREKLLKYGEHTLNPSVLSAMLALWNFRQRAEAPSVIKQRGIFHWGAISYELIIAIMIRTGAPGKPATQTVGKRSGQYSMKCFVCVTDNDWCAFLLQQLGIDEDNFWQLYSRGIR
jgi:hypothetical protein